MHIKLLVPLTCLVLLFSCSQEEKLMTSDEYQYLKKADSLIKIMTLEEKIGQLNHLAATKNSDELKIMIKQGKVGALTGNGNPDTFMIFQRIAIEQSRLKIPLFIGFDIIHGFKTSFPVPLAQAASWDLEDIEQSERIAATEATSVGMNWTFAPMIDIGRDPRWGRVMEGAGEDPYLGSLIAKARVKGFQGTNLSDDNSLLACAKHLAGYGCVEAGREYNYTDISERAMRETYLPPFKAAIDEGVGTIMNAFSLYNGIPASASEFLVHDVLKKEWGFLGFTISDARTFYELIPWGLASDSAEAATKCINATSDMDLWSNVYANHLPDLIKSGKVSEKQIDESVRRILYIKYKLGLFKNPYKGYNKDWEKEINSSDKNDEFALQFTRKCLVLLKNENNLLPLQKNNKSIAIVGQLADSHENKDYIGTWSAWSSMNNGITLLKGMKGKTQQITYLKGCNAKGDCPDSLIEEALKKAKQADIIVMAVGENGTMSGENTSRTDLTLPGNQEELIEKVAKLGKPVVLVVFAGRPMVLTEITDKVDAILYVWQPGALGGQAIADVLFGDYNPSGKITMTFPYAIGQVPIYYNHFNTGNPTNKGYIDCPNEPLYPFGYGLSYTNFDYSELSLDKRKISFNDTLTIKVKVTNAGNYDGTEIVQLYTRDLTGSVVRPVKELKGFKKIFLKKGEEQIVEFKLSSDDLAFWTKDMVFKAEPGKFNIFTGTNSVDVLTETFELTDK